MEASTSLLTDNIQGSAGGRPVWAGNDGITEEQNYTAIRMLNNVTKGQQMVGKWATFLVQRFRPHEGFSVAKAESDELWLDEVTRFDSPILVMDIKNPEDRVWDPHATGSLAYIVGLGKAEPTILILGCMLEFSIYEVSGKDQGFEVQRVRLSQKEREHLLEDGVSLADELTRILAAANMGTYGGAEVDADADALLP